MKTKLILACLALSFIANAQWVSPSPNNLTDINDRVGIRFSGPASWLPGYAFHVLEEKGSTAAGYFDIRAVQNTGYAGVVGVANDPSCNATSLVGVAGTADGGTSTYGVAGTAGNSCGTGNVTIGVYGKLAPMTGPYSAFICAGVYGDDWSTGGSSGSGPNWGGFFVGDVSTTTGYYIYSDRKIKTNIKPLTNALDKIMLLKPSTYDMKADQYKGLSLTRRPQMGLIAQELEEVFPDLVKESAMPGRDEKGNVTASGETIKSVNYVNLIPVLIAAVQEQQQQIAEQREMINDLSQKLASTTGLNNVDGSNGFTMSQNEPNPFNGETVVKYTLPEQVKTASLLVYDLSGKQIASFPIIEKGSSSLVITSEKLAAGIYIYSIVADNKIVDSKRMVIANK